jgi:voltage-gated potassium channel
VYIAWSLELNFIIGLLVNLSCIIIMLMMKSYTLFYASLIVVVIVSARYYSKIKSIKSSRELSKVFLFNLINICFSIYGLFQIIYYHSTRLELQRSLSFGWVLLVETAPVAYMFMIYSVVVVLVVSVNNYLSFNSGIAHIIIIKTAVSITMVVLLIVVMNAVIYYLIHNFALIANNGLFAGNFLKDPIKFFYRSSKPFSDFLWFSATTFFTVGYGDMHPVGNIMYLLSTLEMISAYILGIVMIPILLFKVTKEEYRLWRE